MENQTVVLPEVPQWVLDKFESFAEKNAPPANNAVSKEFRETIKKLMTMCLKQGFQNGLLYYAYEQQ